MFLVADEDVDRQIVEGLREIEHDVVYVAEFAPGISDSEVLELANTRKALLITSDKDFGELVFRQRRVTRGVLLLRLAGLSPQEKVQIVTGVLRDHEVELPGAFSVVTATSLRIRTTS